MICSVFKRKRRVGGRLIESSDWFASLRMEWETGPPRKWCLHVADKREAERLLHEARTNAEKRHHGLLPPDEVTEAREQPLTELLEAFLGHLRGTGRAESTLKKYRNMRVLFARCGWRRIPHVTARSFHEWRTHSELSGKAKNDLLKNTCNFFAWMRRSRMVTQNPLEFVDPVKLTPKQFRRALSPEQAQKLLAVAPRRRAVVYLTALQTGLRRNELKQLTAGDFALDAPKPFVRVPACIAKNRKETTLWLREEVVSAVRSILPDNAMPFERVFTCIPRISTLRRDLERAGIPFEDADGRRIDFHALRVTLGANLLNVPGMSYAVVKEVMRHSDIRTTFRHYCDASQLPIAAAVASLPAFTLPGVLPAPTAPASGERATGSELGTQMGTQTGTQTGVAGGLRELQAVAGGRT